MFRKLRLLPFLLLTAFNSAQAQVPVASITTTPASPISGCAPLAVSFNGSGTGVGLTYTWTFPGGSPATSTSQNQVVVYNTPGPWTASLVVSNANGNSTPAKVLVTVNPVPTASFTEDKTTGCYPTWINFTNTTVPNVGQGESITSYLWNFGDGSQSTASSPSHRYLTGGNIQVVLYVNNNFGCTGKSQVSMGKINLTGGIFPNFFSNLASTCNLPVTDSFVNTSVTSGLPNISWNWDFGDGAGFSDNRMFPTHPYTTAATYTVRLAASSSAGCSDTTIHQVNITANGNLTDFTYPDTVCVNTNVTFKNISSPHPVSSMWDYGFGPVGPSQDGSYTYSAPGTYSVTLTNNFGACNGSNTHTIVVVNAPTASFTGTNLAGCKAPLTATFTNTSTGATSWSWNFGDGTTSNLQNPPPHVYSTLGTFPVTLMTSSAPGCSATATAATVTIQQPTVTLNNPLSFFGCAPYTFTPSATISAVDGVATYNWNFGNGNTATTATAPPQTYGAGSWTITLTIMTTGGCTATASGVVLVGSSKPTPVDFSFVPPSACVASAVQFTSDSPTTGNKWYWDFGDGNIDNTNNPNPSYSYLKPGTFNVKLTEYDNGCWDTISHAIVVNPPLANFTISPVCGSTNSFTFTDASLGPVTTYLWNFNDGTTSNSPGPITHTFPAGPPKSYNVTLTATTGACSNTSPPQSVTANQGTVITLSPNPVCVNSVVIFTAAAQGNIVNYQFEFGDGNSNIGGNVSTSYVYTKPGTYTVKVVTFDINGCVDSSGVATIVVRGPIANFTPPPALSCTALTVNFKDLSTALPAGDKIVGWDWNFGDGGSSPAQDPSYTYTVPGTFTPSLTVTDQFGCTGTLVSPQTLTVSLPVASLTVSDDTSCPNAPIPLQFTNTSTGGFNPVYTWKFGDGNTSNAYQPPPYAYTNVGTYPVTLSIIDAYGCTSNSPITQIIVDTPHAAFNMSGSFSACPPFNDMFMFTGNNALTYAWDFGNGVGSSLVNPSNLYVNPGDYYPNLTITSHGGCASVETQHVHIDGPIGVLNYSPLEGCDTLTVNFNVASSNVVSYTWNFGEPGSGLIVNNSPNMTFVYNVPGQYYPVVTLVDSAGCHVNQIGQQPINIDSIAQTLFTADKTILCDSGMVNFTDVSVLVPSATITITNYTWNFGDGTTQSGMLPTVSHKYTSVGSYAATMSITTLGGCSGLYTLPINVVASPKVAMNGLVNQCEPAVLNFSGSELVPDPNGPLTWSWSFGNGQSATGQFPAPVNYPKAGEYIVSLTATNTAGCSMMTDTTTPNHLFIYPIPTVEAGADVTICDTSTLQLNATGTATTYNWLPPVIGNLSCLACSNPLATSPASTYFIVQGTTLFGCKAQDTINVTVNTKVIVNATGTDSVCLGQSASLNATGAAIYNWTPAEGLNNPNIANPVATPDASQIGNTPSAVIMYTVTGYDDLKCYSDTKSINITAFNYPAITLTPNATINVGSSYQISSAVTTNIVSLNWTPSNTLSCSDCLTPLATPTKTTKYDLTAVNDGGCSTTDSIRVQVICNGANFFVPNTFSPNGDGINDRFIVNGVGLNVIPSITIYNRWGQIVFQKSNFAPNTPADAWDGTFNGQPAPSDVYIYTIQILCNNATLIPYHGNVTLIR